MVNVEQQVCGWTLAAVLVHKDVLLVLRAVVLDAIHKVTVTSNWRASPVHRKNNLSSSLIQIFILLINRYKI